jgi:hypothetical protein
VTEPATSRPLSGEWIPTLGHEPAASGAWNAYNSLVFSDLCSKIAFNRGENKRNLNLY